MPQICSLESEQNQTLFNITQSLEVRFKEHTPLTTVRKTQSNTFISIIQTNKTTISPFKKINIFFMQNKFDPYGLTKVKIFFEINKEKFSKCSSSKPSYP